MTPLDFAATRRLIGLTIDELATRLSINPRTIRGYEAGEYAPTEGVLEVLRMLRSSHDSALERLDPSKPIKLPRGPRPRGWYIALSARVLDRHPDATIDWID